MTTETGREARGRGTLLTVVPPREPLRAPVPPRVRRARRRRAAACLLLAADAAAVAVSAAPTGVTAWAPAGAFLLLAALNASAGLYRWSPVAAALGELPRLAGHSAVAWCAIAVPLAHDPPWTTLLAAVAAQAVLACCGRGAVYQARARAARRRPRPALVVGSGPAGQRVAAALAEHPEYGMRPVALVGPVPARLPEALPLPVLGSPCEVTRALVLHSVRDAVLTRHPVRELDAALLRLLWDRGCTVWLVAAEPETVSARVAGHLAGHLWGFACRRLEPPGSPGWRRPAKRALDVAVALPVLVLAAPLLACCALAVRLADGPGVIFRQERVGRDGRRFTLLKFRTLRPADEREAATRWSVAGDQRISAVGRLLRRTSLDELPQLWNVLRGDMSLVGPRPERPHFVERFSTAYPGYALRHRMPTGLTGLAQVSGLRGDTSIEDRARFDNHYIDTWSPWQDLRIVLRTAMACVRLKGS